MSIFLGGNGALAGACRYASSKNFNKVKGEETDETNFADQLKKTGEKAYTSKVDAYMEHLRLKYGSVRIQSVGKDQESLERIGKSMSGSDVVIAPNILKQMAKEPAKAFYYEKKIDYYFNTIIPKETAFCAACGLVYEPGGVVVHEDGTVTYIGGCSDSPDRVAKVNAINKAKKEKEAAQQKANMERGRKIAEEREWQIELAYRQKSMAELVTFRVADMGKSTCPTAPELVGFAVVPYENDIGKNDRQSQETEYVPP